MFGVCVLNAGAADHAPLVEVRTDQYDATMAVNIRGAFLVLQQAARRIANDGRIVAISSTSTAWPSPGEAVYATSKAVLEQFVRVASRELGHRGVTVNIVSPGATDTDLLHQGAPPEALASMAQLTGQNLRADGGLV